MRMRQPVWVVIGALALSGAALAQGGMGMKGGMGMMGDGDAKITKEQFLQRAEEHFARMDANNDGAIDATDRAAMRKRMQDCMGMMGMGMMGGGMGMMGSMPGSGDDE